MDVSAIDLFCGAGGLICGLERAGINVEAGIDIDPACEHPVEVNTDAEFIHGNVAEIAEENPDQIAQLFDETADAQLLAGCAPCQPFSPLTHGEQSSEHQEYALLSHFAEIVNHCQPDIVVAENVYEVRHSEIYNEFVFRLQEMGYNINPEQDKRVYCPEYDIPQTRRRWVLLASKEGSLDLSGPINESEEEYPTVEETIDDLNPLQAGETDPKDPLHSTRSLSETNLERIRHSKPGGSWRDWPDRLVLDCHMKDSGQTFEAVYGRMNPEEPAPTITTQFYNLGSGRFGHYDTDQDRALSLREGALLQTFPEDYEFFPDDEEMEITKAGRMIGNAVPPQLGKVIGQRAVEFLEGTDRQMALNDYPA